jgi:hypothetical protein
MSFLDPISNSKEIAKEREQFRLILSFIDIRIVCACVSLEQYIHILLNIYGSVNLALVTFASR